MSDIEMERQLAGTLARSDYPTAWFENYPTSIYRMIKILRRESGRS